MKTIILTTHIIVSVILITLVVLQAGKDSIGTVFGGSNTGSVFGGSGAGNILTKLTGWFAFFFFVTSLSYTYVSSMKMEKESVIINIEQPLRSKTPEPSVKDVPNVPTTPSVKQ